MAAKAKQPNSAAVDAWLARLREDQRTALERMREQVKGPLAEQAAGKTVS